MSNGNPKVAIFDQLAAVAKAIASGPRLQILELLAQGERSVEMIGRMVGLSIANASQHLQSLRRSGLVVARKDGKHVLYRLGDEEVVRLLDVLRRIAERRVAEVDRIVRTYFDARDDLEPVSRKELLERMRDGVVSVLDVRPPEEYAAGHLPGARNIPLRELEGRLSELPRRRQVIAYCRGPYCVLAYEAVALLRRRGFKAQRLEDGYPEWKLARLPVSVGA